MIVHGNVKCVLRVSTREFHAPVELERGDIDPGFGTGSHIRCYPTPGRFNAGPVLIRLPRMRELRGVVPSRPDPQRSVPNIPPGDPVW
jgi:hypothetical protein